MVTACLVTRGDVDMTPVIGSLPPEWPVVVWDNSRKAQDWAVYGRYAATYEAESDLIYVQDDDCLVSDPRALVALWHEWSDRRGGAVDHVVCNMPQEFRHVFYAFNHALVGFGAVFHRTLPPQIPVPWENPLEMRKFLRCCDIAFTARFPRVFADVPVTNLPHAHADNRMWKQPNHQFERAAFLERVLAGSTRERLA